MRGSADKKEVEAKLQALGARQEERLARHRAEQFGLPYVDLFAYPIDQAVLGLIDKEAAAAASAVVFYKKGNDIRIGAVNPKSEEFRRLMEKLTAKFGVAPSVHVISHHSLRVALSRYQLHREAVMQQQDLLRIDQARLADFAETLQTLQDLGKRISSVTPSEILITILAGAVSMHASDVHVEPRANNARLRYRVDGVLQDIAIFGREGWETILSRVKVMSQMKLNVHNIPQDGSFVLEVGDNNVFDVRVSVLPGAVGEYIVLRLLSRQEGLFSLEDLGMKERDVAVVRRELRASTGMILAAGPTGSGKTTTIVAALQEVNRPELKVITLEDPIEYRVAGVEQTEVNPDSGYTFAVGLRSILRQDPDIIFVGEMRDVETAQTSVHAAMTGHLVFSTIHANDAPGALLRLTNIGIDSFVLAPALNVVISQRLVRKVCSSCAESYQPEAAVLEHIRDVMEGVHPNVFNAAVLKEKDLRFVRPAGCNECGGVGYRGRIGLFEVFSVSGKIEDLILAGAPSNAIRDAAMAEGMTTIAQDGYLKVIDKITTIEEVARVSEE